MHELSITQSILSIALEQAEVAKAAKVTRINVAIGELTGIVDESVRFYFELLSQDTIAAGASLGFDRPPARLRCTSCGNTFSPDNLNWVCPGCHQPGIEIVSGRQCSVTSIEVE